MRSSALLLSLFLTGPAKTPQLPRLPFPAERAVETGTRGTGGDRTLVIDRSAESVILDQLDELRSQGYRFTEGPAVNARGEVFFNDVPASKTYRIGLDGKWVGAVKGTHTYMEAAVTPGEHHVCAERQSVQASMEREAGFISFTAERDKRYYFRARFTEDSGVKLDRINDDDGRLLISSSRLTISTPKQ